MNAPRTRKIHSGLYEVIGSRDSDGKPYRVDHVDWRPYIGSLASRPYWAVQDSRRREVSRHFTMRDALLSVPVVTS